jgi:hypothetical protein
MSILLLFLPWILFSALSSVSLPLALGLAFILSLLALLKSKHIMEWTTFIFFLISFSLSFYVRDVFFHISISFLSSVALSLIAWCSLWLKQPFTLPYAKKRTTQEFWNSRPFMRINEIMTLVFGVIFSLEALIKLIKLFYPDLFSYSYFSLFFSVLIVFFVSWFPEWYKKRELRSNNKHGGS